MTPNPTSTICTTRSQSTCNVKKKRKSLTKVPNQWKIEQLNLLSGQNLNLPPERLTTSKSRLLRIQKPRPTAVVRRNWVCRRQGCAPFFSKAKPRWKQECISSKSCRTSPLLTIKRTLLTQSSTSGTSRRRSTKRWSRNRLLKNRQLSFAISWDQLSKGLHLEHCRQDSKETLLCHRLR